MSRELTFFVVYSLVINALGFFCGFLANDTLHQNKAEAARQAFVEHGFAHWEVSTAGEVRFVWNEPINLSSDKE